ncbi:MAG: dihydroneopterin aldolase [Sulfuricurvum sp.]|nr:dihydroneopterin aldolase [Sulfuricurvum sp.]
MTIVIEHLCFETILGILPEERVTPQTVQIDCTIEYPYANGSFINYADVAAMIQTTMVERRFELIETALEVLTALLKASFPLISELTLSIRKPDILPQCTVGVIHKTHF